MNESHCKYSVEMKFSNQLGLYICFTLLHGKRVASQKMRVVRRKMYIAAAVIYTILFEEFYCFFPKYRILFVPSTS